MKNNINSLKFIITITFLIKISSLYSQNIQVPSSAVDIESVINTGRIEETHYKLVMYNQNKDTLSRLGILDRQIVKENYKSNLCFRITEIYTSGNSNNKTTCYVDSKTLKVKYYELVVNDTLAKKCTFDNGKLIYFDLKSSPEKVLELPIPVGAFLSNCFSELIQSNNFAKTPIVNFKTFSPGNPSNQYIAERINEIKLLMPNNKAVVCWVLKFTRIDEKGNESLAGYRYIDKVSGKVLMFKSDIKSSNFFTYQILFL